MNLNTKLYYSLSVLIIIFLIHFICICIYSQNEINVHHVGAWVVTWNVFLSSFMILLLQIVVTGFSRFEQYTIPDYISSTIIEGYNIALSTGALVLFTHRLYEYSVLYIYTLIIAFISWLYTVIVFFKQIHRCYKKSRDNKVENIMTNNDTVTIITIDPISHINNQPI